MRLLLFKSSRITLEEKSRITVQEAEGKKHTQQSKWPKPGWLWGWDLTATACIQHCQTLLSQKEKAGAEASHYSLIQRLWGEQRNPHCLLQLSLTGRPLTGAGKSLQWPNPATPCSGEEFPSDRAHRSLHSTTGLQESSGKASSAQRSLPQKTTKSNKYHHISQKTSYNKP